MSFPDSQLMGAGPEQSSRELAVDIQALARVFLVLNGDDNTDTADGSRKD